MRRTLPSLATLALLGLLTACGGDTAPVSSATSTVTSSAETPTAPAATTPAADPSEDAPDGTPSAAPTTKPVVAPKPAPPKAPALTCTQLGGAQLGSAKVPFNGYPDYLPLLDGIWNGEDGATVELQKPCGIGDLDGDGSADAARAVLLRTGGVGQFWSVAFWHNSAGKPAYRSLVDLGDRNPVTAISVSGQRATVVWLTRSDGKSMAELDIERTSVYQLSGTTVTEVKHTDVPYTP
ncbi:hypothetical protein [Micromonospora auratinigra]|uniref:Lipoprotein n=1 Tax=Micromonospora auratinigra TaxID=261654 RepID=A0A1A8ZXI5_9ACTN|nr:hypothetical protein [Micromonospora auratinigra]SBT48598.1 hypothetical protein GA0070611_4117 [Micromonospora auratinigra]